MQTSEWSGFRIPEIIERKPRSCFDYLDLALTGWIISQSYFDWLNHVRILSILIDQNHQFSFTKLIYIQESWMTFTDL